MTGKENPMKNYLEEIYPVNQFIQECPALSENANRAKESLKRFFQNGEDDYFVVIEVEGYYCVAYLLDSFSPYTLAEIIVPFDNECIYPIQGLVTKYAFKRY